MSLLDEYDHMFDSNIKGYNGAEGPFKAKVNMGPVEHPSGVLKPILPRQET